MKISLDIQTEKVNALMKKRTDEAKRNVARRIANAANLVRNTAVNSIRAEPKTGKVRKRDGHVASAAGEPPASDTGILANSISTAIYTSDTSAEAHVVASTDYAAHLEFGTQKMAARPFMQPALERNREKIIRSFKTGKLIGS